MEDELNLIDSILGGGKPVSDVELVDSLLEKDNGLTYNNLFETFAKDKVRDNTPYGNNDYITEWDNPEDADRIKELQAARQPWAVKFGSGIGRVGTKAGTEILKIPGVAGGIMEGIAGQISDGLTGRDNTDFMEVAFDNAWVRNMNDLNQYANDELLPVYVKKAVQEGSLWKNLMSIDFWATDGADGLGYIAAMFAPGAILNKLKLGKALVGTAGDLSNVSKGIKFSDDALTGMQKMAKLGLPTNAKNIDLYSQTIGNTILEAGAEAQQAGQDYENENKWRTELDPNDEQYLSPEEYSENKARIMRNIFGANAAILIGPNAIMSKMLWGGVRNSTKGLKNFKFDKGVIQQIEKKGALRTINEIGQDFAIAGGREGFWEEGMQSASSNFFSANPNAGFFESIGEIPNAYADMITTTDGQKAIALGKAFGGGMQSITNYVQNKKENDVTNRLISYANSKLDNFWSNFEGDLYERDEQGNIIKEDGEPKLNLKEAEKRLRSINQLEQLSAHYDLAVLEGNSELASQLRNEAMTSLIADFLNNDQLGIEFLESYLKSSPGVEQMAATEKVSKESIISDIMDTARALELGNETFDNFSESILNVKNENATEKDKLMFYQGLRSRYFSIKARKHFVDTQINRLKNQRESLLKDKGRTLEEYESNGKLAMELDSTDSRFESITSKLNNYTAVQKELDNIENDFWNKEAVQKEFDTQINHWRELEKQEKEKEEEVSKILDNIDKATTEEELNNISKSNTFADKVINDAIVNKRKELEDAKNKADEEILNSQNQQSNVNKKANEKAEDAKGDLAAKISSYNVGEEIPLTKAELLPYVNDLDRPEYTGLIESEDNNKDDSVTIRIMETGQEITIPKVITKSQPSNPQEEFSTEGSVNHDELTPTNNENEEDISESTHESKSGTPLLSIKRGVGKKITFKIKGKSVTEYLGEPFKFIKKSFLYYERNPVNKKGTSVTFRVIIKDGTESYWNDEWTEATNIYNKVLQGYQPTNDEKNTLIDFLPLNGHINNSDDTYSPINTLYETSDGNISIRYKNSIRNLRINIVNALLTGVKLEDISTTIEGQYGGVLIVDELDQNGNVRENNVLDLYHFKGMSDTQKIKYIRENIGMINQTGKFIYLNGNPGIFNKSNAKGEIYLNIPKANGEIFPLKLNIKKLNDPVITDIIAKVYQTLMEDNDISMSSTFKELNDDLKNLLKDNFKNEKAVIGKPWNDITINDILSILVFDKAKSLKSRIGFLNQNDPTQFMYGDPDKDGRVVNSAEQFDVEHFKKWLVNNKRQVINFKPHEGDTNSANMTESDNYIKYLLYNNILNTNAVVGENQPTFQGYTNIYLDSNNIKIKGESSKSTAEPSVNNTQPATSTNELGFEESSEATPTDNSITVKTNSGNITIHEDGSMFYDNGNEVIDEVVKNKALVKKENEEGTLRRSTYNNNKYAILSDDRIISLNPSSAGKEVYKTGTVRDKILNSVKAPPAIKKPNVNTTDSQTADIERRRSASLGKGKYEGVSPYVETEGDDIGEGYYLDAFGNEITTYDENPNKKWTTEEIVNWINAKYDAELAALNSEGQQWGQTTENITGKISDKEYNDFVNTGNVSQNRINFIASKIKNNQKLNQREIAIFNDKTSEINSELSRLKEIEDKSLNNVSPTSQSQPKEIAGAMDMGDVAKLLAEVDNNPPTVESNVSSSGKVENNTNNARNSKKSFVSLHEIPNTEASKKVAEMKEKVKKKDEIKATDELIKELTKFIIVEKKAMKIGGEAWKVFSSKTNQEKFDILKDIANTWNYNIDNIITKCS